MNIVVVDEDAGDGDERDITGEAAVIEPVIANRRDAVDQASGIDGDDNEVGAGVEDRGDFAIERREASFVIADPFLVDPNMRAVIGCTDVEEAAGAGLGLRVEISLIPDDALVVKQLWNLSVPITGNFERWRGREVVLLVVISDKVGVFVHGIGLVVNCAIFEVERAGGRLVNKVVPVSIQAGDGPVIETDEKGLEGLLAESGED